MTPARVQPQARARIAAVVVIALTVSGMAPVAVYLYLADKVWGQRSGRDPIASFPFDPAAHSASRVAIVWLALAVAAWVWCGWSLWRHRRRTKRPLH